MKYLIIICLFISTVSYGQVELGRSLNDIKNSYKDKKYEISQYKNDDGTIAISVKLYNAMANYYFNESLATETLIITPYDQNALIKIVQQYDQKYGRANSDRIQWRCVTSKDNKTVTEVISLAQITDTDGKSNYNLIWEYD